MSYCIHNIIISIPKYNYIYLLNFVTSQYAQLLTPISIYEFYINTLISIFIYFIFISSLCYFITWVSLSMLYYFLSIRLLLRFLIYFFLVRNRVDLFLLYFLIFGEISYDLVIVLFVFVMFLTITKKSIIFYVSSLINSILDLSDISAIGKSSLIILS